jgi:hypothetical protein
MWEPTLRLAPVTKAHFPFKFNTRAPLSFGIADLSIAPEGFA